MNSKDLLHYIEDNQIDAEMVYLQEETPTVAAAAAVVNVDPEQIGKSLLFIVEGLPVLVIANGMVRVDYKELSGYLGVNRKRIKLANPEQVRLYTGYEVGTLPPFGHKNSIRTIIERSVSDQQELFAGGGDINTLLRLKISELVKVTNAPYVDLKKN